MKKLKNYSDVLNNITEIWCLAYPVTPKHERNYKNQIAYIYKYTDIRFRRCTFRNVHCTEYREK
jgi:hypothetical protein